MGRGMPIGCMKGAWLMPVVAAGMLLGGIIVAVALWNKPWLIPVAIVARIGVAIWGMRR